MGAKTWLLVAWWLSVTVAFPNRKSDNGNFTENVRYRRDVWFVSMSVFAASALAYPTQKPENGNLTEKHYWSDENESVRGAYGRGVGFFIGEPCETTCNKILFHVYCNRTTGKCECHDEYPVNINNKICVKVAKLGEECEYSESCAFINENAICHADGDCRCDDKYQSQFTESRDMICIPAPGKGILPTSDITTLISVVAGLMIFTALFCLVLKLFSRARFNRPRDRLGNASAPSVMTTGMDTSGSSVIGSRPPSRASASTEYLPGSHRPSYSMLAPPSLAESRRPSCSSVRSQLSLRSHSSLKCHRGHREIVRRTISSPSDTNLPHPSPFKIGPCHSGTSEEIKQPSPEPLSNESVPNHI